MRGFNSDNLAKNLPDAFRKDIDSNNYKLLDTTHAEYEEVRNMLQYITNILDVNNATGKTLDLYGLRVGQARGLATDPIYLLLIKGKIMRNISGGSYKSIVNALCATFDCEPSQVLFTIEEAPCTVTLAALPLASIVGAGLTTSQTVALVKALLPVGVTLDSFLFDGTFEFAANEGVFENDKGFTDVEGNDEIGGFFGVTNGDENDILLPI